MSNRKYPRLADGYHDRSQYHPYQTSSKYSSKSHPNCNSESNRDRERSPVGSSNSPYSRHTNFSPRSHRSKSYSRSREGGKRGSSKSPGDGHSHHIFANSNSHGSDRNSKPNHVNNDESFAWSQHTSSSGKIYYYNCKTEKSQWEKPKEWIERERREKDRKEREKRDVAGTKDGGRDGRDPTLNREHLSSSKTSKYMLPSKSARRDHHSSVDKRDGNHLESRNSSTDDRKDVQRLIENDRVRQVVKTYSVHTSALPTVVYRSDPVAANIGGETTVSPAGSLQDVSPPTTPSSRPNSYGDHSSHTPSPNVMSALSPPVSHQHGVPSPQLHFPQTSPQFPPRHGGSSAALNVFPQVQLSSSPRVPQQYALTQQQYGTTQQGPKQQINDYRQFSRTNSSMSPLPQVAQQGNGGSLSQTGKVVSPQPVVYKTNASPQPVLHPLQQATLVLQQRKMSEAQAATATCHIQQAYPGVPSAAAGLGANAVIPHQTVQPPAVPLHLKDDRPHLSSPGSPVLFPQQTALKDASPQLPGSQHPALCSTAPSQASSSPLSHSSNASSPVPVSQPTAANLQSLAKYVDKNLAMHVCNWPTDLMDRQMQKLWEESSSFSNDSDKTKIEQIQLQSETGFLEMRLETASRRISSLKGMTRTLEALLAESDSKFLS